MSDILSGLQLINVQGSSCLGLTNECVYVMNICLHMLDSAGLSIVQYEGGNPTPQPAVAQWVF